MYPPALRPAPVRVSVVCLCLLFFAPACGDHDPPHDGTDPTEAVCAFAADRRPAKATAALFAEDPPSGLAPLTAASLLASDLPPQPQPLTVEQLPRPAAVDGPPAWAELPPPPWAPMPGRGAAGPRSPDAMHIVDHDNPRARRAMVTPEVPVVEPSDEPRGPLKHVIGADDRRRVVDTRAWPHRAVVKLLMRWGDDWYSCSGAVVQPTFVLTAGHCVYSHDHGRWADDLIVVPGQDGDFEPYGRWDWESAHSVRGWIGDRDRGYDLALLRVRGAIGDQVGHFGMRRATDAAIEAARLHTAGYPGSDVTHMYDQACTTEEVTPLQVLHRCDTEGGQSGSPMWVEDDGLFVIAVHAAASSDGPARNYATRLADELWTWLNALIGRCVGTCAFGAGRCVAAGREACGVGAMGCADWVASPCDRDAACVDGGCACPDDAFEPNDEREGAAALPDGVHERLDICAGDDDWYRIAVTEGERVSVELHFSHRVGDLDMEWYDERGGARGASTGVIDVESLEAIAEWDGEWRLRVYGYAGATGEYVMVVDRAQVAPPGWQCALDGFATGDGCDCACGAPDPDCRPGERGSRGCGADEACVDGWCACAPDCAGRSCGGDGCGGECGECGEGQGCVDGRCACQPACDGRTCGDDDGCGGLCEQGCDGGAPEPEPEPEPVQSDIPAGCACRADDGDAPAAPALALIGLVAALRRRRRAPRRG